MLSSIIFESHGRLVLLEALTPNEARAIFKRLGATAEDMATADSRKSFFRKKSMELHPDRHKGDLDMEEKFKALSSANDTLKNAPNMTDAPYQSQRTQSRPSWQDEGPSIPAWQTDERSSFNRISRENYTDMNYFKMKMWELSGKSREKFTITAFDGSFFRSTITVYGSEDIYQDMAKAMIVWNSHGANPHQTRAVFVQKDRDPANTIYLIYLSPAHFFTKETAIPFEHDSMNRNPANDQQFARRLPRDLDNLQQELEND